MIPLSRWFDERAPAERPVAFGREGERSLGDLRGDVAALAARIPAAKGGDWLLHCEDAYAFSVGLLALAQVGARAVLPPSRQPGTLRHLSAEVDGALLDGDPPEMPAGKPCWHPLEPAAASSPPCELRPLDRDAPLAVLFTSGTTGAARRVEKAVRHLEDEVGALERCFGAQLGPDARVLATVAPHHLYGLLFRVLWPLATGRPFLRSPVLHPEELAPHSGAETPFAVATTPVTLRHLVLRSDLARRSASCRAVFSSGGPLAAALAARSAQALGRVPVEVYGSTETGGIATRQQREGDEPWQPMPGVEVAADEGGRLAVTSPFVSVGEPAGEGRRRFVTGDGIADAGSGAFRLLGRTDRVVKVGERRLALPDMEEHLRRHPAVADVALLALALGASEARVAAVVVPSAPAWDTLAADGRRAFAKTLGEHLAPDFERVLLPRAWRFVAALPRDAQGKVPGEALRALFEREAPALAAERLAVRRGEREIELHLRIPWDLAFFDGHFPGSPIVPGVVQVHFALLALGELLGRAAPVRALEALKLHDLLEPGTEVRLRVSVEEDGERFRFSLEDAADPDRLFASCRGRLGQSP